MNLETIKRRVSRLRALMGHKNTSVEEREAASGRITVLMDTYNLSETDISPEKTELISHRENIGIEVLWPRGLAALLSERYQVESVISVNKIQNTSYILFNGYKEDVARVVEEWRMLYPQILDMASDLRSSGARPIYINFHGFILNMYQYNYGNTVLTPEQEDSWGLGLLTALGHKLRQQKENDTPQADEPESTEDTIIENDVEIIPDDEVLADNALIVSESAKLETVHKYIEDNIGITEKSEEVIDTRTIDQYYAQRGYAAGFTLNLDKLTAQIERKKS